MKTQPNADIGLIGLAVMGENIALNLESKGFHVACFNRTLSRVDDFLAGRARGRHITGCHSIEELLAALKRPRALLLMVKAGHAVDALVEQILPLLDEDDVLIDGGNTWHEDTTRRMQQAERAGKRYVGMGVSGGEEGALHGPSLMPGGSQTAWPHLRPLLEAIAAKAGDGQPCCAWIGPDGSGHFVKTVHNGIEYGDMQLIAEAYALLRDGLHLSNDAIAQTFASWNGGELNSYLIEITAHILATRENDGSHLIDRILDAAAQKGTGRWTIEMALRHGQPLTLIAEAVLARSLSALREEREAASAVLAGPTPPQTPPPADIPDMLRSALFASKMVSYAQGFQLMRAISEARNWHLQYGQIARIWRAGCVIRSSFLDQISKAFEKDPSLCNLMLDDSVAQTLAAAQSAWRRVCCFALERGMAIPAMSSALAYYDGYRTARLPANLIQAQRDFFGAHLYERTDHPRGEFFHTNWTGAGGTTVSGAYSA